MDHGKHQRTKNTTLRLKVFPHRGVLYTLSSKSERKSEIFSWRWGRSFPSLGRAPNLIKLDLRKCQLRLSLNPVSGASTLCSCRNSILPEICRTLSISLVRQYTVILILIPLTFKTLDPKESLPPNQEYYKRVSTTHEFGGYGSAGYRAPWSHEESSKLLLRTHTTASSAHMLYKLAAKCRGEKTEDDSAEFAHGVDSTEGGTGPDKTDDGFRPAKLFSIDRVFRNETMDATHLAEFHQVEGVVADRNLTLADLIGKFHLLHS